MHITALFGLNIANKKELVVTDKDRLHYLTLLLVTVRKFTKKCSLFTFMPLLLLAFCLVLVLHSVSHVDIAVSNMNYP